MKNSWLKKSGAPRLLAALLICAAAAKRPMFAKQASGPAPSGPADSRSTALAIEIIQMWKDDQALLDITGRARNDPAFRTAYMARAKKLAVRNFAEPIILELWAKEPGTPEIVRRYVRFRNAADARIESIVAESGWPQRATVGDEGAADFFFLFGHADDDNPWRITQLPTLERVFREDTVNPGVYAHFWDRLADVAGKPQIYGTVMGPAPQSTGSAKLHWPLSGSVAAANERRKKIGLPSIEDDLEKFRRGAMIGPFMIPRVKGAQFDMADVYRPR